MRGMDINEVKCTTKCILVADGPGGYMHNLSHKGAIGYYHFSGANIAFVDGHVGWYRKTEIPGSTYDGPDYNEESLLWWNIDAK